MSDTWINGNRVSFVDVSMEADGTDIPIGALRSINWQGGLEPGIIEGNAVFSPGRTSGYYKATCDFEMLLEESDDFEDNLTNSGDTGLLQTDFFMQVSYALTDESYVETVKLRGTRIKTHGASGTSGNDALYTKYECTVMRIERNGRPDAIQSGT